jgi:hypothetical protein
MCYAPDRPAPQRYAGQRQFLPRLKHGGPLANPYGTPLMPCTPAKARKSLRDGRLAFKRVKGQPPAAYPKDCQLLQRRRTIVCGKVV